MSTRAVDEYRVDMFDMTRTTNSWLQGFPARLELAESKLGQTKAVKDAQHQWEIVKTAKANCDRNNGKTVKNVIFSAAKLNEMLITLEHDMEGRDVDEDLNKFWRRQHEAGCPGMDGMGVCECD